MTWPTLGTKLEPRGCGLLFRGREGGLVIGDGEICNGSGDVDDGAAFICGGVQLTYLGIESTKFK